MTSDVVPNGIKIEWNAVQNSIPVVNRVYVVAADSIDEDELNNCIVAAKSFFDDYKAICHPTYVLQNITATDVSVANGAQVVQSYSTDNVGTGAGVAAAANAAMCTSLRTAHIGRSFRGRFYLGGLVQGALDDAQTWNAGTAVAFAGWFEDFMTTLGTINKTLVVVSRWANNVQRIVALATEVLNIVVDNKVDSQRRRTAN